MAGVWADRATAAVELDADHRRHATVELAIRDLKDGAGLCHCPSGVFLANAAWATIATLAHNLLRWIAAIGLGARQELVVAKTLRRTLLALPGRITRSARRLVLNRHGFRAVFIRAAAPVGVQHSGRPRARQG